MRAVGSSGELERAPRTCRRRRTEAETATAEAPGGPPLQPETSSAPTADFGLVDRSKLLSEAASPEPSNRRRQETLLRGTPSAPSCPRRPARANSGPLSRPKLTAWRLSEAQDTPTAGRSKNAGALGRPAAVGYTATRFSALGHAITTSSASHRESQDGSEGWCSTSRTALTLPFLADFSSWR